MITRRATIMDNRPPDQLVQIALDLHRGRIYSNLHLPEGMFASEVFIPLALLDQEQFDRLVQDPPGLVFEYMHKANEWAVNDLPQFFSVQMLSKEDAVKVFDMATKLAEAEQVQLEALKP